MLARHGFRATVFVATAITDGRASFVWYARQPPLLTWAEIAKLDSGGTLEFEAHSVTHPNLLALDDERARYEIAQSKTELEQRLARRVTAFSYPTGLFGERKRLVEAAGYDIAVSCEPGVNLPTTNRFALRRRQIDGRDSLLDFRAKLAGGHEPRCRCAACIAACATATEEEAAWLRALGGRGRDAPLRNESSRKRPRHV